MSRPWGSAPHGAERVSRRPSTRPHSVEEQIRRFIVESLLFGKGEGLTCEDSLLEQRIVDSTGLVDVVGFVTTTWGVEIDDAEILPENFGTIRDLAAFVQSKLED